MPFCNKLLLSLALIAPFVVGCGGEEKAPTVQVEKPQAAEGEPTGEEPVLPDEGP